MHIVVVYQYYHTPDCPAAARHYTFIREWSKSHRVTVITGDSWFRRRLTNHFDWRPEGVDIRMLEVPYDNSMPIADRLKSFARFAVGAVLESRKVDPPDIVFGTSTPLTAAWAARRIAHAHKVRWIFEVRDLWPDFPIEMGAIRNRTVIRALRRLEQGLYRDAAHVIALSPDMENHITGLGVDRSRVSTVLNGTDFDLLDRVTDDEVAQLKSEFGLGGMKVILYAGMFGRANSVETVIEAARLATRDDLRFVLIGDGYLSDEVRAAAAGDARFVVPDPLPRHAVFKWFKLADLTLVPFKDLPVLAANSPSKFFDSLAAGTPVIVTNPGWTKRFVEENDCGWYVPPENPKALIEKVNVVLDSPWELARAGVNGRRVATDQFDRVTMAKQIENIMIGT